MTNHLVRMSLTLAAASILGAAPAVAGVPAQLAFTPVEPCRILDTRNTTAGAMRAGDFLSLSTNGDTFINQGGFDRPCGLPAEFDGDASAVAYNITTTGSAGTGWLEIFAYDYGQNVKPNSSIINYASGLNIANSSVIGQTQDPTEEMELTIWAHADTHVIVDVIGYYTPIVTAPI